MQSIFSKYVRGKRGRGGRLGHSMTWDDSDDVEIAFSICAIWICTYNSLCVGGCSSFYVFRFFFKFFSVFYSISIPTAGEREIASCIRFWLMSDRRNWTPPPVVLHTVFFCLLTRHNQKDQRGSSSLTYLSGLVVSRMTPQNPSCLLAIFPGPPIHNLPQTTMIGESRPRVPLRSVSLKENRESKRLGT